MGHRCLGEDDTVRNPCDLPCKRLIEKKWLFFQCFDSVGKQGACSLGRLLPALTKW
jgi:hypothetical protein